MVAFISFLLLQGWQYGMWLTQPIPTITARP